MNSFDPGMSEHDIGAIKREVADFVDEKGWSVFHYAAYNKSQPIMEILVQHLKGIFKFCIYLLNFTYKIETGEQPERNSDSITYMLYLYFFI